MATCEETKVGEVYVCKDCGFAFEVVSACDCENNSCTDQNDTCCEFVCCGKPMTRK